MNQKLETGPYKVGADHSIDAFKSADGWYTFQTPYAVKAGRDYRLVLALEDCEHDGVPLKAGEVFEAVSRQVVSRFHKGPPTPIIVPAP